MMQIMTSHISSDLCVSKVVYIMDLFPFKLKPSGTGKLEQNLLWLLEVLATSKVMSGWALTCDSAHFIVATL